MTSKSTLRYYAWTGNLILLAAVVLVGLVAGELLVRAVVEDMVLYPRYHARATYGDVTLRRLRPSTSFRHTSRDGSWQFVTNAQGFRDDADYRHDKPPGRLRVLALGDSHTQGMEVRQARTFAEVLERDLVRRGRDAEVLNAGISGFSTAEELLFLEHEGVKYQPDWVVLGLYANDFEDNVKSGLFGLEDGRLVARGTSHIPGVAILEAVNALPPARWLSENSYLYSLALNTAWETAKRLLRERSEAALVTEYAVPTEALDDYRKDLLAKLVERLHQVCRAHGIRLAIVDIPTFGPPGAGDFGSSIPPDLVPALEAASDRLLLAEPLLGAYRGLGELHVPHGHRHISELSHLLIGMALAEAIAGPGDPLDRQTSEGRP